ncbi:MAG: hypothetical protein HFJ51_04585 [Clostridia bacterium]|nr:hypothetical protein [Clostridia bacterium]
MEEQLKAILDKIVELNENVSDIKWDMGIIKHNQDNMQRELKYLEKLENSNTEYIVDIFKIYNEFTWK